MKKLLEDVANLKMEMDVLESELAKSKDGKSILEKLQIVGGMAVLVMFNDKLTKILKTYYEREQSVSESEECEPIKKRKSNKKIRVNKPRANAKNGNRSKRLHSKKQTIRNNKR